MFVTTSFDDVQWNAGENHIVVVSAFTLTQP